MSRLGQSAFTLIEMMVTVAVVAVLLGFTLPALRGVRVTADSTACLVSLSSIAKMQAAYAAGNNGHFPYALEPGQAVVYWDYNNASYVVFGTIVESDWWPGPLWAKGYYETNEPTQGVSCPVVFREVRDTRRDDSDADQSPTRSYRYSAAMFTEAAFWDPADKSAEMARRDAVGANRFRKSVRIEEVKFPSHKVVMSERADFHGRRATLGDPSLVDFEKKAARSNVSFADGHVDRVDPYRAQEPLAINWSYDWLPNGLGAIPFSAAAWGYRGRDY